MFDVRRARLLAALDGAAALIVAPGSPAEEGEFRRCASPDLYYLTGWEGPGAALFRPGASQPYVLFVPPRRIHQEMVVGLGVGLDEAVDAHAADAAFPLDELEARLEVLVSGYTTLHYAYGHAPDMDARVWRALRRGAPAAARNGVALPTTIVDAGVVGALRGVKDAQELALLRRAGAICAEGHRAGMSVGRAGVHEYVVQAEVEAVFRRRGGQGPGYASIVGGGANACTFHYAANNDVLRPGTLCLVDAGCRVGHYTTDLTRTWPVDGRFSGPGRALYEVVHTAWQAGYAEVRAGVSWSTVHDAVLRTLTEGLVALELLHGDVQELIHEEEYRRFYPHEVGHWLGLDVHDPGAYYVGGRSRMLEVGMVLALEPGLYVQADDDDAPEAFRGVGVRIEDDLVVTEGAAEILTDCPRSIAEIEGVMAARGR
jgi:Xaa-Pro aminopeptidase